MVKSVDDIGATFKSLYATSEWNAWVSSRPRPIMCKFCPLAMLLSSAQNFDLLEYNSNVW